MFEISFDDQARILHLQLIGHWDEATFARFRATVSAYAAKYRLTQKSYAVLSDASAFAVQTPAIAEAFADLRKHDREHARAVAIVVASMLNRLQVNRTTAAPNLRVFDTRVDAIAWLHEVLAQPAAA